MCRACKKDKEEQKHIIVCEKLYQGIVILNNEKIMDGNMKVGDKI